MIQAPISKPIETPKAKPQAEVSDSLKSSNVLNSKSVKGSKDSKESEVSSKKEKNSEFAKELEAFADAESEVQVKPVQVSAEQALEAPSTLIDPSAESETASPKVFDPSITKGVEKLIQPKTSGVDIADAELVELAQAGTTVAAADEIMLKGDFKESLLNAPKLAQVGGRAPSIDFAQTEVDPQLLGNEDFVAQKNLANKKVVTNAYGMKPAQAQQQKLALENGLNQTQVVKEASAENMPMNSQQFILNLNNEQTGGAKLTDVSATAAAPKTFDMSSIKSSNPTEIMNQITDYVVQAKAAKETTVNMRVNHDELGMIDITVSRVGAANADAVAINIGAHSADGKNFFQQNSKDLFSHLATAGVNVADLKVETPAQTAKNDFDFGSQSGRNQQGSEKQFGSEQNQRRHDQERRQDLWKLLNKEAA